MFYDFVFFSKLFIALSPLVTGGECILIETKQGKMRGQMEISRGGRQFYAFYGIPYAEPPVGELRFENPVPAKKWERILDATILPPACFSVHFNSTFGQEDCLYLNVYTPRIDKNSSLPVMVYVYGGNFMYGHALPNRYGPHYFMDKDIIIITFHYRLGPLGFLSTGDEVMPGNYGLKDILEVLRWVQHNIQSFGGDKNVVTLAGGSSGGEAVAFTLVSPLAKGLFHRGILQSGPPKPVAEPDFARRITLKFTSFTNCRHVNTSSAEQLKSCLKKLSIYEIGENMEKIFTFDTILPNNPYGPSIESEKNSGAFLIDNPYKLLKGNINIPLLLGINSGEGGMMAIFTHLAGGTTNKIANKLEKNYRQYFPELFNYENSNENVGLVKEKTEAIVTRYFGDSKISENHHAFTQIFTAIFSTRLRRIVNAYKSIKYVYYYDHRNEESFDKYYGNPTDEDLGVLHGDELISMFNWSEAIKPIVKGVDLVVSEQVLELWVNFATFGDPNGKGKILWSPMKSSKFQYLHIRDGKLKMETELMEADCEFWENYIWS